MLLVFDVGSTDTVAAAFDGPNIVHTWRIATDPRRTPDEHTVLWPSLLDSAHLDTASIGGIALCSVVPAVTDALCQAARSLWPLDPLVVSAHLDLGLTLAYSPVESLGADRIANAVAATESHGAPVVVVDLGTATTFDVVGPDRTFLGGAIAAGAILGLSALLAAAPQLPRVSLEAPPGPIGNTTATGLRSGLVFGHAALVDGLVARIRADLGTDTPVVATGGLASVIAPHSATIGHIETYLTLHGTRLIYERNA